MIFSCDYITCVFFPVTTCILHVTFSCDFIIYLLLFTVQFPCHSQESQDCSKHLTLYSRADRYLNTILTSLESIHQCCEYCAKTIHVQIPLLSTAHKLGRHWVAIRAQDLEWKHENSKPESPCWRHLDKNYNIILQKLTSYKRRFFTHIITLPMARVARTIRRTASLNVSRNYALDWSGNTVSKQLLVNYYWITEVIDSFLN